jgi:NADPH2:quinone reductase
MGPNEARRKGPRRVYLAKSMRIAIEMQGYGGPDVLVAAARPALEPGADEVVVHTIVTGVNRADLFIRAGTWKQAGAFPYVPGLEVAGTVARAGRDAGFREGEAVITMMQRLGGIHGERAGGYQTEVLVPAATLARVPEGLEVKTAGVLGLPAVTALLALDALDLHAGQRVLVQAGSSAVGAMALQMIRAFGAIGIGSGMSPAKFDFMRASGAAEVVDTRDASWPERLPAVDRVLELVGSATFSGSVRALARGGRLVFAGGTSGGDLAFSGWDLMRETTLTGYSSETLDRAGLQGAIDRIAELVRGGHLAAREPRSFSLASAADAHRAIESGKLQGRVVLEP